MEDRWYIVQLGDYYDEIFHNIGGTKGQQPGVYIVTGPDFNGAIPGEMTQLRSRTRWAAAALGVFVKGEADLPAAAEAQRGFHLPPLPPANAPDNLRFFRGTGPLDELLAASRDRQQRRS